MSTVQDLPPKQREVLEALMVFIRENGYPPSIQQLCERCGVSSTSTIHHHVSRLKEKGFIDWNPAEKRAITIRDDLWEGVSEHSAPSVALRASGKSDRSASLPLLGSIAAGKPLMTDSDASEKIDLAEDLCPPGCYALRVRVNSMIEDHIMDGDIVIINPKARVRDGDIVVALVEGQTATLKRIYKEKGNVVRLQPANAQMEPIFTPADQLDIQGRLETVIRCC